MHSLSAATNTGRPVVFPMPLLPYLRLVLGSPVEPLHMHGRHAVVEVGMYMWLWIVGSIPALSCHILAQEAHVAAAKWTSTDKLS